MRFALIFATLVAGAMAATLETPFEKNLQKEVKALNLDPVSLPDVEFQVNVKPVKLTQGKAEGLSDVVRPSGRCFKREDNVLCHLSFSGLTFTYKAQAEATFDVEVTALHSLLEVLLEETPEGKTKLNNVRVTALHQYVKKPVEFSGDREQTVLFDDLLKEKLVEVLKTELLTGPFKQALEKAFAVEPFPTKEANVSFDVVA